MQQLLAFLAVALCSLLLEPLIDFGIFEERLGALAVDERLDTRGSIPMSGTPLARQVFHLFLFLGCQDRGAFHWLDLGANANGPEIVHKPFNNTRIHRIARVLPGIE